MPERVKILHYSFGVYPYATGGLPLYVHDLIKAQKKLGYEVNLLLPRRTINKLEKITNEKNVYYINHSLPISSIFGMKNPEDYMRSYSKSSISSFLDYLNPNILHIHSLMGIPKEFLEVAKERNIRIVYTTHDYYGLCLKCNFVDSNGHLCDSRNIKRCASCNYLNGLNRRTSFVISTKFYKVLKKFSIIDHIKSRIRLSINKKGKSNVLSDYIVPQEIQTRYINLLNYYREMFNQIDIFHFNSYLSRTIFNKYISNTKGIVNPITLAHIKKDKGNNEKLKNNNDVVIGYIGRQEPYKGLDYLMATLKELDEEGIVFKCYLYGDDFVQYDGLYDDKVINKGRFKKTEQSEVYNAIDVLVLPSICKESFGFVVLEALSYNVPVLVSENVGSGFLLNSNCIFNINSKQLKEKLEEICKGNIAKFLTDSNAINYDINQHALTIMKIYEGEID